MNIIVVEEREAIPSCTLLVSIASIKKSTISNLVDLARIIRRCKCNATTLLHAIYSHIKDEKIKVDPMRSKYHIN